MWLKAYQRLGYFPKVGDVPPVVVRHVRDVLGLGEGVELERAAVRSAKRHREFVRKRMRVAYDGAGVRRIAEADAIRRAVQTKGDPADLINVALEELVRARCELPGYTTLGAMAAAIRAEVSSGFCRAAAGRLDAVARAGLARMLVVDPVSRRSEFDRLKDVAKAASLGRFKERLDLLGVIDAIGPAGAWLDGVPPGKVAHFAGEARVTGRRRPTATASRPGRELLTPPGPMSNPFAARAVVTCVGRSGIPLSPHRQEPKEAT